ncbi:MAG: glycosyl hydrolase family 28-related protein [Candidatus Acidiferrales bacterium]
MKHLFRIIAFLALLLFSTAAPAFAQGVSYNDVARTADNTPLSNGMVAVCSATLTNPGNVGEPCAPLVTIYTGATLAISAANPINADIHGNFHFWAPPGTYFIEFYSPSRATAPFTQMITLGCVPNTAASGCGSGNSTSVTAYGAKCDDTTDDTAAIQAAVNALPSTGTTVGGTVNFPAGACKTTAAININTPNVTLQGTGHFQFITQNPPPSYIDFQGSTPQNAVNVNAQGFAMDDLGVKYPTTIGGPLAAPADPTLTAVSSSGCPAEAYYVEATYVSAQGETSVSPESTIITTSGQCFTVTSPPAETGATGWRIYASSNSNNETLQVATLAIGTNWTFGGTLLNLGFRPAVNTTAYSAIYDPNGAQLEGVKLFTNFSASVGTASTANGYTSFGCCGKLHNVTSPASATAFSAPARTMTSPSRTATSRRTTSARLSSTAQTSTSKTTTSRATASAI